MKTAAGGAGAVFSTLLGVAFLCAGVPVAKAAGPVRSRSLVLVDSSGAMLLTPGSATFTEQPGCDWNPCFAFGNPLPYQEQCNPCVRETIRDLPSCATSWSSSCSFGYNSCFQILQGGVCGPTMSVSGAVSTRGDGSLELPGCDLDGDGFAHDSRLYQAKEALAAVIPALDGGIEFALWRHAQVEGGQICTTSATCPDTPGGQSILDCAQVGNAGDPMRCAFDADRLDGPTPAGFEGQCSRFTYTGSPAGFTCAQCSSTAWDRALCELWDLDRVRSGAVSPLDNISTVQCYPQANPQHRFMKYHGAVTNTGACDPAGGQSLVDFPASGFLSNRDDILEWLDHRQPNFALDDELRASGLRPLAAALRDIRQSLLATLAADQESGCRPYQIVVLAGGAAECTLNSEAVAAAAALQDLAFTNSQGMPVTGYAVPVHVIGFAVCPSGAPGCQAKVDLDAVAAAGGTSAAAIVETQPQLEQALTLIAATIQMSETCNGVDDDCDALVDEDFSALGQPCSAGVGACQTAGQYVCTGDGDGTACNAVPGPPGVEACNGIDDDCDGVVDDGFAAPGSATGMTLDQTFSGKTFVGWNGAAGQTSYDVITGDLAALRSSGGDFSAATTACLAEDTTSTWLFDSSPNPPPGSAVYYLVRAINCITPGTWNSGGAGQQGTRDPEIAASPVACH